MKKQKLVLTGLVGFAFLFGCSQVETVNEVKAGNNLPSGFVVVAEDEEIIKYQDLYTIKNTFSGCYYILSNGFHSETVTQMFIEKDGVTVPYCDKVGE